MKAIKVITSSVLALSALTLIAACGSKSKTADSAYAAPTTTETATPITDEAAVTPAPEEPAYLGASSSGLGL